MSPDSELLRRFTEENSEEAFAELVRRHLNLVYSTARRIGGGDCALAEDAAQAVFVALARKAGSLVGRDSLSGWLYTSAHHAACAEVRRARRRRIREQEAHAMNEYPQDPAAAADWERLRPMLDDAMHALNERDREAVLLRFFEGKPFAEIGERLRLGENATRMRVARALEKLRAKLARRGIASTGSALAVTLAQNAVTAAPSTLATELPGAALAAAATGGGAAASLGGFLGWSKLQITTAIVGVLAGIAGVVWQLAERQRLQTEIARLQPGISQAAHEQGTALEPAGTPADPVTEALVHAQAENYALQLQLSRATDNLARETALLPDMVPVDHLTNAGRKTPGAALETLLWSRTRVDLAELERTMVFTAGMQRRLAELYARWPADARSHLPEVTTAGQFAAMVWTLYEPAVGIRMFQAEQIAPDQVQLGTQWQYEYGSVVKLGMNFTRTPEGWKWSVADDYAERVILTPMQGLIEGRRRS